MSSLQLTQASPLVVSITSQPALVLQTLIFGVDRREEVWRGQGTHHSLREESFLIHPITPPLRHGHILHRSEGQHVLPPHFLTAHDKGWGTGSKPILLRGPAASESREKYRIFPHPVALLIRGGT
jgi:hypothetical protein